MAKTPPEDEPKTPTSPDSAAPASSNKEEPAVPADTGKSLIRSAGVVGFMTILSRLTGLWRFRIIGAIFGASGVADAFYLAFVFPNITRRLFGEGAMTSAFVPVFSHRLAHNKHDDAQKTASVLVWRLTYWLSLGAVVLGLIAAGLRYVLPHVVKNFNAHDVLAIKLFIAMLPYMICINVAAVFMAILNSLKHFAIPAFAPVILNGLIIATCYFGLNHAGDVPEKQVWALAVAVLAGGLIQILIQLPPMYARGFRLRFTMDKTDEGYREVMGNFMPVVLLVAVFQANVMIDNIIAAAFIPGEGPVTYLNMGTSVYQLPWSIFSLALGTAALPALSELWALKKREQFSSTLLTALRITIFLAIPCTIGIVMLSEDIVRLLYGAGKFLDNDGEPIRRTAAVVKYSSLGLIFYSLNSVLARALYAMKDMKTPTSTSAKSVALNLVLNLAFVNFTDMKEGGIALASTISNGWQTWALIQALRRQMNEDHKAPVTIPSGFLTLAGSICASAALAGIGYKMFTGRPDWEGFWAIFAAAFGALFPFWLINNQYFQNRLKDQPKDAKDTTLRMGVKEEHWSDWLKFEHALYTTAMSAIVMGFVVWAVRDSVPPEGRSFTLVVQRALIPVIVGAMVYATMAGGMLSREYEDLRAAFAVKLFRRKAKPAS